MGARKKQELWFSWPGTHSWLTFWALHKASAPDWPKLPSLSLVIEFLPDGLLPLLMLLLFFKKIIYSLRIPYNLF